MKAVRVWLGPGVAVLALAGLLLAWHVESRRPATQGKAATGSGPQVIDVNPDTIQKVVLTEGGRSLTLVRASGSAQPGTGAQAQDQWYLGTVRGKAAQASNVDNLLFALNPLTAQRKVALPPAQAGLTPPAKTLTLVDRTGATTVLEIGAQAPVGGYYARLKGGDAIYLIDATVPDQVMADPSAWLPPPPASPGSTSSGSTGSTPSGSTGSGSPRSTGSAGSAG